jgi:hypothetical protein
MQQALNDDYRFITQFYNWNFLLDRYDIPLVQSYNTGTVSVVQGSTAVTGTSTAWVTNLTPRKQLYNQKILLTGDNEEKEIASFNSDTSLTLRYPYNSSSGSISNVSYMIFQDSFPLPISPGRDLTIVNPLFQWQTIKKWDRVRFDAGTSQWGRFLAGVRPTVYTDDGVDITTGSPTIGQPKVQFWPLTTVAQDLVLRFFKQFTPLLAASDVTILPPEFEEVMIRLSKARLKQRYGIQGWTDDRSTAMQMLLQFREAQATSPAFEFSKQDGSGFDSNDPFAIDTGMGYWPGSINSFPGGFP